MSTVARDQHHRMDTAAAEAEARDGGADGSTTSPVPAAGGRTP